MQSNRKHDVIFPAHYKCINKKQTLIQIYQIQLPLNQIYQSNFGSKLTKLAHPFDRPTFSGI